MFCAGAFSRRRRLYVHHVDRGGVFGDLVARPLALNRSVYGPWCTLPPARGGGASAMALSFLAGSRRAFIKLAAARAASAPILHVQSVITVDARDERVGQAVGPGASTP